MPAKCKAQNCTKYASYNYPDKKGRLYCGDHREAGMVSNKVDNRTCKHVDAQGVKCPTRACYNIKGTIKGIYCREHKNKDMINVLITEKNLCQHCHKKQPSYGPANGKPMLCSKCYKITKTTDNFIPMQDLVSNLCDTEDCPKNATRGYIGEKATKCKGHANAEMVDVKNIKCESCIKQATFGFKKPTHCIDHIQDGMKDMRHKSELCEKCENRATFGYKEQKQTRCRYHKEDEMVDLVSTMCITCEEKQASFNYKNMKPMYCYGCKTPNMIDVKHPKCFSCSLFSVAKRDGLCSYCDPNKRERNVKEKKVLEYLKQQKRFKDINFIHDKFISPVYGKYRPDILIQLDNQHIIIEIDENQHKSYEQDCEVVRMANIAQASGIEKPTTFIRYNPDIYYHRSYKRNPSSKTRLQILKYVLRKCIKHPPIIPIRVCRMFYDSVEGEDEMIVKYDISKKLTELTDRLKFEEEELPALLEKEEHQNCIEE